MNRPEDFREQVAAMLRQLDPEPEREGLLDTPRRVQKAFAAYTAGYAQDPKDVIGTGVFEAETDEMVLVKDIELYSLCEHHLAPFFGKAHVAYIPKDKIIGLSKINRVVRFFGQRPQVQERLTRQILVALQALLDTEDVAVSIDATHYCVKSRGVMDSNSRTSTTALGGCFEKNIHTRAEFLNP